MKNRKIFMLCTVMLVLTVMLCACVSKTAQTIKVGNDKILSLYSAVGERKITGTEKGFKNKVTYQILRYNNGDVTEQDIYDYLENLSGDGYLLLNADKEQDPLKISLGKTSSETEKVVLIEIQYFHNSELEISYKVGSGTITPKEEN